MGRQLTGPCLRIRRADKVNQPPRVSIRFLRQKYDIAETVSYVTLITDYFERLGASDR